MSDAPRADGKRAWPGEPTPEEDRARMVRVDQAGEYGALRIYAGQLAVLGRHKTAPALKHMAEQERRHLAAFDALMAERGVRPTALQPLWHVAGYALGAATALLGPRAAMACTVAVEEVIDEHYRAQAERLSDADPELKAAIETARADEIAHRDTALAHEAEQAAGYETLTGAIKAASRLAIWLSTRF